MKVSSTTLACPDWPVERVLAEFPRMGFDAVDFRGLSRQMEIWKLDAFGRDAEATATKIAASGLAVSAFSSSARMYNPDDAGLAKSLEEVRQYARLCRIFGSPIIRVFGGKVEGRPIAQAIPVAVDTLRRMAEIAGPRVTLAVETHDDWVSSAPLAEVIAKTAMPNVKALWDLHHPFRLAGETPEETHGRIGRYVVAVHVKNSRTTADGKFAYTLPGEGGDVPLERMVSLLKQGGYDGYLTLEWEKMWHPELAEPEVALPAWAKYLRSLV
ncbi:MAG: sugar phosphate isomerase/epimerase family protein [Phycisphaerae bacterium]